MALDLNTGKLGYMSVGTTKTAVIVHQFTYPIPGVQFSKKQGVAQQDKPGVLQFICTIDSATYDADFVEGPMLLFFPEKKVTIDLYTVEIKKDYLEGAKCLRDQQRILDKNGQLGTMSLYIEFFKLEEVTK